MRVNIVLNEKTGVACGSFGAAAAHLTLKLEGRREWLAHNRLRFEISQHNINSIIDLFPSATIDDRRSESGFASPEASHVEDYFSMEPRPFQKANYLRFRDQLQWAIFSEQGTGKTKVALDIISWRYLRGMLKGVVVLSSPKGVHAQWVEEQLPKHLWSNVPVLTYIWDGRKAPPWLSKETEELQFISGNIDMLRSAKGFDLLEEFVKRHNRNALILIDESDSIKNFSTKRARQLRKLASWTKQRAIMTGTPIAKDLTDEWAQFYFLNPNIIGHKYLTSFRAQYCIMGGYEDKAVIGHKNIEQFKKLTDPFIFRATKKELDLPEKVYDRVVFDLEPEQKRLIKGIKESFFASLKDGPTVAVQNGAVALLRIQQITNGLFVDEDGGVTHIANPRLDALLDLRRQISGPVVIWCRFREDVRIAHKAFPGSAIFFGESDQKDRERAKEAFLSGKVRELIATPGAAGKGIDGMQNVCEDAIYYSNSYNAIDRWQSEDRIHRIGMRGTATYFDLIARGGIDKAILANLRKKKSISSLALGDIQQIIGEAG